MSQLPQWTPSSRRTPPATACWRSGDHRRTSVGIGRTDRTGRLTSANGWTDHVVTPATGVSTVDGILTGWHEPAASHLQMLAAIAGPELLSQSYEEALAAGYLWHEFGDLHLLWH
ncbi:S-adenosylmethionine:tRNA ribosyltransferase-isomerase [Fodinicola feengrottensis]|uniref:S-adenosylmethionine:tRNA ribosyltransferase-isomerase n=1 Tax=Fodinicola feengrottensis TaxID=435914 RepID=UPI0024411C88|nr:S-adenosylmethionine:tRNA ribosyltransferase-isomerase [Fodinicola feengrottensis]